MHVTSFYIQAKERMAYIYLNHERNKTKYIACYKELAENLPGPPTTQLLGDAYMNIQEVPVYMYMYICMYMSHYVPLSIH